MLKCCICSSFHGETDDCGRHKEAWGLCAPGRYTQNNYKKRTLKGGQNTVKKKRVVSVTTFISTHVLLLLAEM